MKRENRSGLARRTWFALVLPVLGGCNTSDALTPQMPVGNGNMQSSPVTQRDLDRAAAMTPGNAQPPVQPARQPTWAPQNTLEAQARALESGAQYSPARTMPDGQTYPTEGGNSFPSAPGNTAPASLPPPAQQQQASLPPPAESAGTIRFLPIIGAPVQAVTPLSRQLGTEARALGLTIRASADENAEHILKGYLSSFSDTGTVTVIYVWDVLDRNGGRLHRIQGQETVPGRSTDPWNAVPATTMQEIARKSLANYMAWKRAGAVAGQ